MVGILVVALCCGVGGWLLFRDPLTPEQVVYRYFEALADRDADEARSYLSREPDEDLETVLLDEDTVEHKDYTPPNHVEIQKPVFKNPRVATIQVTYRVAGGTYEREFQLIRGDPHSSNAQQSWRLHGGWFSLPANTRTAYPLVIAGTLVPKSELGRVPAFPGAYVVRLARNRIFEASPVTVVAGTDVAPGLKLRLRGNRQAELERQVREHLDNCAARPDPQPIGCPFQRVPDIGYPATVQRRITTYPSLDLLVDGSDTLVTSGSSGRTEVRDAVAGESSRPIVEEQFTVTGRLQIDGERFTYVPE